MDTNEKTGKSPAEDLIVLGVASVETRGQMGITENFGAVPLDGLSEA